MISPSVAEELRRASEAYRHKRYDVAYRIYRMLAEQGHAESQMFVGWMHLSGLGVASDEAQAAEWFEKAAALGSIEGQFYYARYLTKIGRDKEAYPLYRRAAESGHLPSIFWVGYSFARGQGVDLNIDSGYRYLLRAARRGHVHALREVAVLDIKGYRGLTWQLVAPVEFCLAVASAYVLALVNSKSDLVRA